MGIPIDEAWEYYTPDEEVQELLDEDLESLGRSSRCQGFDRIWGGFRGDGNVGFQFHFRVRPRRVQRPRPKRWAPTPPKDKQAKYRGKCRENGKCPRCGRPAAPYYECELHRRERAEKKRLWYRRKRGLPLWPAYNLPRGRHVKVEDPAP